MPISLDENRALEKVARCQHEDTWLADGIAALYAKIEQIEADLKHVQGSDIGMMKLLHAEKVKSDAAERKVEKLREALKPFASMLASYHATLRDERLSNVNPRVGDLRRARAALAETEKGDE